MIKSNLLSSYNSLKRNYTSYSRPCNMAFKANPQANKSEKPKESLFITVPKTILAAVGVFFFIILAIALRDNRKDD